MLRRVACRGPRCLLVTALASTDRTECTSCSAFDGNSVSGSTRMSRTSTRTLELGTGVLVPGARGSQSPDRHTPPHYTGRARLAWALSATSEPLTFPLLHPALARPPRTAGKATRRASLLSPCRRWLRIVRTRVSNITKSSHECLARVYRETLALTSNVNCANYWW